MIHCEFCNNRHQKDFHADFFINTLYLTEGDFVVATDLNKGNRSLTNDIEYLVWWLKNKAGLSSFIAKYKIIYKDSMGIYDGIKLKKDGTFLCWYPIQEKDIDEAIKKAIL